MRILALFVILPLFFSESTEHVPTVRGQICTKNDLKHQDPGCCRNLMLRCEDLAIGGRECCNARNPEGATTADDTPNPLCTYSESGGKSTCSTYPTACENLSNSVWDNGASTLDILLFDKCYIRSGRYDHKVVLSGTNLGYTIGCIPGAKGSCSYQCYGGTFYKVTNTCKIDTSGCHTKFSPDPEKCKYVYFQKSTTNPGAGGSSKCLNGLLGNCFYRCFNMEWLGSHTCRTPKRCDDGTSYTPDPEKCPSITPDMSHGQIVRRSCKAGFYGNCAYKCDDGIMKGFSGIYEGVAYTGCTRTRRVLCEDSSDKCGVRVVREGDSTPKTDSCVRGYIGTCTYSCNNNGGITGSNTCTPITDCSGINHGCQLPGVLSDNVKITGSCANNTSNNIGGKCYYKCFPSTWTLWNKPKTQVTDKNYFDTPNSSGKNFHTHWCGAECPATTLTHGTCSVTAPRSKHLSKVTSTCANSETRDGYIYACRWKCNNGTWVRIDTYTQHASCDSYDINAL